MRGSCSGSQDGLLSIGPSGSGKIMAGPGDELVSSVSQFSPSSILSHYIVVLMSSNMVCPECTVQPIASALNP